MADLLPGNNPLTVRLRNVAQNEGVTVEQLADWPDNRLRMTPNLGTKSINLLRRYYPARKLEICPHCGQDYDPDDITVKLMAEFRRVGVLKSDDA